MLEVEIDGQTYRIGKLNAFQQLHLSRKIAPILPKIFPVFIELDKAPRVDAAPVDSEGDQSDNTKTIEPAAVDLMGLANAIGPLTESLAAMPDADFDYVLSMCLGVVSLRQGQAWAPVWNAQGKVIMFDFMDIGVITQLVTKVIWSNLGPFIQGMLAKAQASKPVKR